MFGKLLKNDLKAQWHFVSTIYLVAIIVAAVAEGFACFSDKKTVVALASVLVIIVLAFTSLVTLIAVAIMFSNTLFGRAGYLTLTLPVKTSSLVRSKSLSGLIWIFVTYGLLIGSIILSYQQLQGVLGEEFTASSEDILALFGIPSFFSMLMAAITLLVSFVAVILVVVQSLYLGIALSNVSPINKLGNFGAILFFFVVFGVIEIITSKLAGLLNFGVVISESTLILTGDISQYTANGDLKIGMMGTVLRLLCGIGLHFPITAIVKNKVNIK